jgi:hypothetical protein
MLFIRRTFLPRHFFYLASTSRSFSNSLHISCNKIKHIELMLPKEHDFDQDQNYGHRIFRKKSLLSSFSLFTKYFSHQIKVTREIIELPHTACQKSQFVTNIDGLNTFFTSSNIFGVAPDI